MAHGYSTESNISNTPRCKKLDEEAPLLRFEYDELYWLWRDLAQALERELLNARSDLETIKQLQEGRHGLG